MQNHGPESRDEKIDILFEQFYRQTDRHCGLYNILYLIKRNVLWLTISKESCMQNHSPDSRDEESEMLFEKFSRQTERQTMLL